TAHRAKGTWHQAIDRYVVLTPTMKALLTERNHLPAHRIAVRPNCLFPDPAVGEHRDSFALFVGQLSEPKGIPLLLKAWEGVRLPIRLKIVGDGPLHDDIEHFAVQRPELGIDVTGRLGNAEVLGLMQNASFLVFPSCWYECMPVVLIEAFACGLPVIAGNIGAMLEMISDGENGIHFRSGDPEDLAAKITDLANSPDRRRQIGRAARGYESLMSVYESLLCDRNN
ncbi:MAG: glycosyltransferase family 4 protein, partial [Planctomycetes bacterium]|nr:glycosyltransferase family 4 protein [Planctomycetota bacterium]